MFAVIHLPDFCLQAVHRALRETRPMAVVEAPMGKDQKKTRIVALNDAARESQVHTGMTAAQGQARCGKLILLNREPELEAETRGILLRLAGQYTPDFEDTGPGLCTLDLAGARQGDGWELGWELVEELAGSHGLGARVGIASTPDLALLAARAAEPVRSLEGDSRSREFFQTLPVDVLKPPADISMVLTLWGIHSVGDFLALPRHDIADRLGPDAVEMWEMVSGRHSRLLRLVRPATDFSQVVELDYEIETLEPLLFLIRRQLETICSRLVSAWLAAGEIHLRLDFANRTTYERSFRVPDPSCEAEMLFGMLHTHLEDFVAKAPITGFRIEATPARKPQRQYHLFESGLRDPNRFAETLARLEALLGSDRVGIPEVIDTHRPDAFRVTPFREDAPPPPPDDTVILGLPLRRFRPPIVARVMTSPGSQAPAQVDSPKIRGAVCDWRGPWRSSGDWWTGTARWARVEWDVELAGGGLYRLAREGKDDWKLEGVYG